MEDQYSVNDFGCASLIVEKKGTKRGITCFGTIQAVEKKFILFKDNDDYLYLCEKKNFNFEKCEKIVNH
jgi:hypothetical protein